MKLLGSRTDYLTIAFRVALDPELVARLKDRQEVANRHGRAAFEWAVEVPDTPMGDPTGRRVGSGDARTKTPPLRVRWMNDFDRVKRVSKLWGELRHCKQRGVYHVTNEPYFRLMIQERAAGERPGPVCYACKGSGRIVDEFACVQRRCPGCEGTGTIREPGWTVEVVWYAQELARSGLAACLDESRAVAAMLGDVLEMRLRRLDLCADVEGWEIRETDLWNIDKRPRAKWTLNPDSAVANDVEEGWTRDRKDRREAKFRRESFGRGAAHRRKITGIVVGRGGSIQSRIYDKRAELELDTIGRRREAEETRWRARGWDGEAPVARVEFQLQGEVLDELGIRDPDACVETIRKHELVKGRGGRQRMKTIVVGRRIVTVEGEDGRERQATLVDRIGAVWATCLNWIRLIVPSVSRNGNPVPVARCAEDARWTFLRAVRFEEHAPSAPIRRHRARRCASAAQALGVALSQASHDGRLRRMLCEHSSAYEDDPRAEAKLRARVLALMVAQAPRIVDELVEKHGGIVGASVHFAVRQNAALAKRYAGVELVIHQESRPPPLEQEREKVA